MPSGVYRTLRKRLNQLVAVLPTPPSPGRSLSQAQKDGIAFYAVMTHAACEHYLERRCSEIADHALDAFTARNKLGRVGKHLCLLPYVTFTKQDRDFTTVAELVGASGFGVHISSAKQLSSRAELTLALDRGHKIYQRSIEQNHGISYKYQFKLLSYLGVDIKVFSPNFLSRVDQLATLRGEAAHKGVVAAQTLPSITDLPTWTQDLLDGYLDLDDALKTLKAVRT